MSIGDGRDDEWTIERTMNGRNGEESAFDSLDWGEGGGDRGRQMFKIGRRNKKARGFATEAVKRTKIPVSGSGF